MCLELLGDVLSYHQRGSSDAPPQSAVVHHRLAYTASAVFAVRLLQTIVPPEKVCERSVNNIHIFHVLCVHRVSASVCRCCP